MGQIMEFLQKDRFHRYNKSNSLQKAYKMRSDRKLLGGLRNYKIKRKIDKKLRNLGANIILKEDQ